MKLVESGDYDSFREMGRKNGLMELPVIVDYKKVFKDLLDDVYFGIGTGD